MVNDIPVSMQSILFLTLVMLLIKHFLADYPLQTKYMLQKVKDIDWVKPLLLHSLVHGALTALVLTPIVGVYALAFALFDFIAHTLIDYWKARLTHYTIVQKGFWTTLGLDQLLHNLTYVAIAFIAIHLPLT